MITKFSEISDFGVFDNYLWNTSISPGSKKTIEFKKLNIIYGQNYSGKTTLSRVLQSFETGFLPEKYPDVSFTIETDKGSFDQNDIGNSNLDIRVYNKDFIVKKLKFLQSEDGNIEPFAIFGEQNVDIENQILELMGNLGSVEGKSGLNYELALKNADRSSKEKYLKTNKDGLEDKLRKKANSEIKTNPIYQNVNYNIKNLRSDIDSLETDSRKLLDDSEIVCLKNLLKEEVKQDIEKIEKFNSEFNDLLLKTNEIIVKEIKPTEPIQDLINDALLQEWVHQGISYHKGKRKICAFCGNTISKNLWEKLDAHFNKESNELRESLDSLILLIESKRIETDYLKINSNELYSPYVDSFKENKAQIIAQFKIFNSNLGLLISELNKRKANIFQIRKKLVIRDNSKVVNQTILVLNEIIENNNNKTKTLANDQNAAREDLRLDEVGKFVKAIDYYDDLSKLGELKEEIDTLNEEIGKLNRQISEINNHISNLINQQKDETKGAEKVNEYLNHFFGNESLEFKPVEDKDGKVSKFQIERGGEVAYNLSEGECSLVSFCYFMAKLHDLETEGKDLIIWIDDPISSLDSSHIFFIYSLIENELTKPIRIENTPNSYKYEQLFISTHNLDFLKYLKRLSRPKKEYGCEFFIIERIDKSSKLQIMPKYLKNYTTEFNYLFHQIYKCSNSENTDQDYERFYNFGNNLRKFLEAYLFYKYPYNPQTPTEKLEKFFGDDGTSASLTTRINNEYSHLEEIFDRSMRPLDVPEIPKLANFVLRKIEEKDKDQYDALMKSIGE